MKHRAPLPCAACAPLLARERAFHGQAFETLSRALDAAQERIRVLEAALRDPLGSAPALPPDEPGSPDPLL